MELAAGRSADSWPIRRTYPPVPVTGAAQERRAGGAVGAPAIAVRGPDGASSASLHDALREGGHPLRQLLGRRAALHLERTANPAAALALVRSPRRASRRRRSTLERARAGCPTTYSEQVSEAVVVATPRRRAYVEELERRVDDARGAEELPSGESLAAELTRFLREREEGWTAGATRRTGPAV